MSRIIWVSNGPWCASGYAEQTALFVPRIAALGHDVAIACNYGHQGSVTRWNGFTVYPATTQWGETIGIYAEDHQADLIIILHDAWVLKPDRFPDGPKVAVWAPIDHYPVPPEVLGVLKHEKTQPIAMSRFGEKQMRRFHLDPCYVPHGIDTSVFRPNPDVRGKVRAALGIPEDAFLVGMVAANSGNPSTSRKSFPQAFEAFLEFAKTREDAWLYAHTQLNAQSGGSQHFDQLLVALALEMGGPIDRVKFPPDSVFRLGFPRESVANLYQAFDAFLNPAMGEGFGVPIIEALACGVPVITSDHSAMTELTEVGWLVVGDRWWDDLQGSFFSCPSIKSIQKALEAAYDARADQGMRQAAVEFAQQYDADIVTVQYWEPALERLLAPVEVPPLVLNGNRAQRRAAKKRAVKETKKFADFVVANQVESR